MATLITKNSSTAAAVPGTGDLVQGELAVNVTDKKVYTKDSGGNIVKVVGSLGNQEANAPTFTGPLTTNGSTGTAGQILVSQGSGAPPQWAAASSPLPFFNTSLITVSGNTFTVPSGVSSIRAYVFGKGGNGVGALNTFAAGGGGGSCTWGTIPVTPGEVFTFDVTGTVASLKKGATTYLTANAGSNGSGATGGAGGAVGSVTGGLGITDSGSNAGGAGGSISGGASAGGGGASGSPVGTGGSAATVGGGNLSGGGGWGGSGSSQGGGGGAGGAASGYAGGGAGGAASGTTSTTIPGRGRDISNLYTDVLLRTCTSPGAPYVGNATIYPGPGGGGAFYFQNDRPQGSTGGFGAGGGAISSSGAFSLVGGEGGFGGGGGGCYQQNTGSYDGTGGAGGIGGGGGGAVKGAGSSFAGIGGAGGSAAVLIFY